MFVYFHIFEKKKRKIWKIEKNRGKNVEILERKLPDKNDPNAGFEISGVSEI